MGESSFGRLIALEGPSSRSNSDIGIFQLSPGLVDGGAKLSDAACKVNAWPRLPAPVSVAAWFTWPRHGCSSLGKCQFKKTVNCK